MLALELGSGARPTPSNEDMKVIHLDIVEGPEVDIVADLNHGIPLPSNVFDMIIAMDVVEHLHDVVQIINEMHRVLKPDGICYIRVPKWGGVSHRIDPTHVRGFELTSFDFFDDATDFGALNGRLYTPRRWRIVRRDYCLVDDQKSPEPDNLAFELHALKPNEQPKGWII